MNCCDCFTSCLHWIFCCNPVPCERYIHGEPQVPLTINRSSPTKVQVHSPQQRTDQVSLSTIPRVDSPSDGHVALVAKMNSGDQTGLQGVIVYKAERKLPVVEDMNAQARVTFAQE